jgi:serine protease Do
VLLAVGAREVADVADFDAQLALAAAGQPVALRIWRDGARASVKLIVPPLPSMQRVDTAGARAETRLGLTLAPTLAGAPGVRVESASGSALLAGLDAGDRITAVNGAGVNSDADFDAALAAAAGRDTLALLVWRGGTALYVPVRRIRP